jgi:hypothetical protein
MWGHQNQNLQYLPIHSIGDFFVPIVPNFDLGFSKRVKTPFLFPTGESHVLSILSLVLLLDIYSTFLDRLELKDNLFFFFISDS